MRNWLKKIREHLELTQSQVAKRAHIDRSYYTQIENGTRSPSIEVAHKIASSLGFNPSLFFSDYLGNPIKAALDHMPVILTHCDLDLRYTWIYNTHHEVCLEKLIGNRLDTFANEPGIKTLKELKENVIAKKIIIKQKINFSFFLDKLSTYIVYGKPLLNEEDELIGVATLKVLID